MASELEILYQAAAEPIGLVVTTDNIQLALQRLYKARRQANDPSLACLQLRRNPFKPDEEIWIIKQGKPNGQKQLTDQSNDR